MDPGTRLGPYEIKEPLGEGGMGQVYRAHDETLRRDVAVKLLPDDVADDPQRLARLKREARSLAALNHPHIAAVHGFEEQEGTSFIVMELVKGRTLAEKLEDGPLPVQEALELGIQIAGALETAHERGIVHRDLKPQNVKITPTGEAKVLDFGLAKPIPRAGSDTELPTATVKTRTGAVMGTPPYMSPEQIRGEEIDQRTDIWAFGCLLYEMLTGQRPFTAQTVGDTMSAILSQEPEWGQLPSGTPQAIERLLRRCLHKDPQRRLHHVADVRIEIEEELREEVASWGGGGASATETARTADRSRRSWLVAAIAAVAVVVAGGLGTWAYLARVDPRQATGTEEAGTGTARSIVPLTSSQGQEWEPALSADGRMVAFTRVDDDGRRNLYVKTVDGGEPSLVSSGQHDAYTPAWSPDGSRIAYFRHVEDDDGEVLDAVQIVSPFGGGGRELGRFLSPHGLSWSPNGESLALPLRETADGPSSIHLLSVETGYTERLTEPPPGWLGDGWPRFSPDGEWVAFVRRRTPTLQSIWRVPASGGEERQLTLNIGNTGGLDWTADGQSIVIATVRPGQSAVAGLWRIPASGGEPEPLDISAEAWAPTVARSADRLAYLSVAHDQDIWRLGGPAVPGAATAGERLCSSSRREFQPQYSADGRKIAFISFRSGKSEVWSCDADGSNARRLTFEQADHFPQVPRWSPDNREVAFMARDPEVATNDIQVVSATGGPPRKITSGPSNELAPSWSRDGRWIYFASDRTGSREIWRSPAEGGDAVQMTWNGGVVGFESPDREYLYFTKSVPGAGPTGIWRIPLEGGDEQRVVARGRGDRWAVVQDGLVYVDHQVDPRPAFQFYDFDTGKTRRIGIPEKPLYGDVGSGISATLDGRWILYTTGSLTTDVMLVEDFR